MSFLLNIVLIFFSIILFMLWKLTYWWRKGVKFLRPSLLFGNFAPTFLLRKSLGVQARELYQQTSERFIGAYILLCPTLIVRDVELIRRILIKDFQHFISRGFHVDESNDPASGNLFMIDNPEKWKIIRQHLTPAFTSVKLKSMCGTMVKSGNLVENYLLNCTKGSVLEMNEIAAQYTTNFIISITYGIEIDCFNNEKDKIFHSVGKRIMGPSWQSTFRILIKWLVHSISKLTKINIIDPELKEFVFELFNKMLKMREESEVRRDDFLQALVDLKKANTIHRFTFNELAAQGGIIFVAGYDTSSITIGHSLYEIAKNPEIQKAVHEEIDNVLAKYNNVLSYECLQEMLFLGCCIDETLRMYPSFPMLNRQCNKDYAIPGTDITIKKGTSVFIPLLGLHNDPKYFPDPKKYDPYRFMDKDNIKSIKSDPNIPYFPFGDGPRNCIGLRMARIVVKIGLVKMISKFKYQVEMDIRKPLDFMPINMTLYPRNGIHLRINRR